jgi:hydrogenase-4 component F
LLISKNTKFIEILSLISSSAIFIGSLYILRNVFENLSYSWTNLFDLNSLGIILLVLISFIGLMATIYSVGYMRQELKNEVIGFGRFRQYYVLLNLFLVAMIVAVSASNPILTWVSIEATTLSTAFLISFYNKPDSMEAAWKYLIINSVGLLLAFFGTLLFLSATTALGTNGLISWNDLLANASLLNPLVAKIAFVFVLIGFGTKMGLVPMHTWLPDAHSKAPVPISSLLSGVLLNIALMAILRFETITTAATGSNFAQNLLIYFGLFSIVLSSLLIFLQTNYKRLLAYSTIEHMGIVAMGIGFGGIGVFAAILHLIYHSLAKPLLFLASGNIFLKYKTTKIEDVKGILSTLPVTGILFFVGILAITGIPPFGIFMTEFSIFSIGVESHLPIVIIALCALAIAFAGFLKHTSSMLFGKKPEAIEKGEPSQWSVLPIVIIALALLLLSLYLPEQLKTIITRATAIF